MLKHLPAIQETWVRSLGWEDPLEASDPSKKSNLERDTGEKDKRVKRSGHCNWDRYSTLKETK